MMVTTIDLRICVRGILSPRWGSTISRPRSCEAARPITLRRDRGHSQDSGIVGGWVRSAIKAFVPLHDRCWEVRRICSLVVW